MMRIDEDVEVEPLGGRLAAPVHLAGRGLRRRQLARAVDRAGRLVAAHGPRAPRRERAPARARMWRVEAVPLTTGARRVDGSFDLSVDGRGRWSLVTASDEELDTRLFA
ncbi:hypothetical protein [Clavibacter tessellarius]|uniref:hypothetical protein n=1 Tax=Clavibacter tessellarius TaxID=31965 RepID=UPI0032465830